MGRRRSRSQPKKKKRSGVLMGLRGGFKSAVKGATGVGDETEAPKAGSRVMNWVWNIITGILLIVAVAVFLRRCGVIKHF